MPTVSVIIPTFNRAHYLKSAIESVLGQTFKDLELIVVDDGSTDETQREVRSYCEKDKRVYYISQSNTGVSVARNSGLSRATGKYVAFLDDDDKWLPRKLQIQVNFMETHPEVGLCYTRLRIVYGTNSHGRRSRAIPENLVTTFEKMLGETFIPSSTVLIRKDDMDKISWFNPRYKTCQDWDLWLRFVQHWRIAALEDDLTMTHKDDHSHLSENPIRSMHQSIEILKNLNILPEYRRYKNLRGKNIARINYKLGREHYERKQFLQAAKHFTIALTLDPLVGLTVRRPEEQGFQIAVRIAKSYAAAPLCLLKGIFHAGR